MANAPEDLDGYLADLDRALKLMAEKEPGYREGQEFYEGTRAEIAASREVRRLIQANADAHPISLAHIPVDVLADKVELASLTATDARASVILEAIVDENDLDDEADDWVRKACYFGDYYAIIDPSEEGDEGVTALKLIGSSPLTTIRMYDRKDGRTALYGVKRWQGKAKRWHALMYYDDCTVKLVTEDGRTTLDAKDFRLDVDDTLDEASAIIEHEGGHMLIGHLAIDGKPYGVPVHTKAYGPQDAITKVSATNLSNVDGQGFGARWALADPMAEADDDIDDDFGTDGPGESATTKDGQTTATSGRVRSVPGAVAILRGIKEVGEFTATSSDDFLKNLDWYVRVMAVACGIALFEFDLNGEQPSGESRRRAEGRSNKHARKIARAAGAFFRYLGDASLGVFGITAQVTVTFNPLETSTDKEGLELVGLKIKQGVPVPQALLEAGYTDEQVAGWYPPNEPHVTPELLTTLATALAALGNAKTLGVITDAELADMLPTILTAARGEGPAPVIEDAPLESETEGMVTNPAEVVKAKADAVGALIRAGADPEQAAAMVGLEGLLFPNVPTTVRIPEDEATALEGSGAKAPAAPTPPAE
jgi:hypothetical protein